MRLLKSFSLSLFLFIGLSFTSYAQENQSEESSSKFNKYEAFSPLFMNEYTDSYHSANGAPGPDYWQNRADYAIKATLDTTAHKVSGKVKITYTNNSPHDLEFLWLQ